MLQAVQFQNCLLKKQYVWVVIRCGSLCLCQIKIPAYVLLGFLLNLMLNNVLKYVEMVQLVIFNVMMEMLKMEMAAHLSVKLKIILGVLMVVQQLLHAAFISGLILS